MQKLFVTTLILGLSTACGLSEEDAREAFASITTVGDKGRAAPTAQTGSGTVNWSYTCADGGTAAFTGNIGANGTPTAGQVSFDLDMDFQSCVEGDHEINGKISYYMDVSGSAGGGSINLVCKTDGPITIDGDTCDSIDMTYNISATGGGGTGTVTVGWNGTVCGYEGSESFSFTGAT